MSKTNPDDRHPRDADGGDTSSSAGFAETVGGEQVSPVSVVDDHGETPHEYPATDIGSDPEHDDEAAQEDSQPVEYLPITSERISKWEEKLLNLSFRNPMIGFSTRSSIKFECTDLDSSVKMLIDNQEVEMGVPPAPGEERAEATLYCLDERRDKGEVDSLADVGEREDDAQRRKRIQAYLRTRLTTLRSKTRFLLGETGNNTLYLVVGFVRWVPGQAANQDKLSPLGLLPVEIVGAGPSKRLRLLSSSLTINPTLMARFQGDFELEPTVEQIDLAEEQGSIVEIMRKAIIAQLPVEAGAELVEDIALSSLSFAEQIILQDILSLQKEIQGSELLAKITTPAGKRRDQLRYAKGADGSIEKTLSPIEVSCPLEADPSQLVAIVNAIQGKSFVLQGPPGTGKSQTIANILGKCAELGKRVLFVAQKQAALEVVQNQLKDVGIKDFVLALHSNKIKRKDFQQQLKAVLQYGEPNDDSTYQTDLEHQAECGTLLDSYAEALHKAQANGIKAYRAFGESLGYKPRVEDYRFDPKTVLEATPSWLDSLRAELDNYWLSLSRVKGMNEKVLSLIIPETFTMEWRRELEDALYKLQVELVDLFERIHDLDCWLGATPPDQSSQTADRLEALRALGAFVSEERCIEVEFARGGTPHESCEYLRSVQGVIERIQQLRGALSCTYRKNIELDLIELRRRYRDAAEMSSLRKHLERFKLQYALWKCARGLAWPRRVEKDTSTLLSIQQLNAQLDGVPDAVVNTEIWDGESTDLAQLGLVLDHYETIEHLMSRLQDGHNQCDWTNGQFLAFLLSERRAAAKIEELESLFGRLEQSLQKVGHAISRLVDLDASKGQKLPVEPLDPAALHNSVEGIIQNLNQLRVWHKYANQIDPSKPAPIQRLCDDIRSGAITLEQAHKALNASVSWATANAVLEEDGELENFVDASTHHELIERFRKLTEKVNRGCKKEIRTKQLERINKIRDSKAGENGEEDDETGWRILHRQLEAGSGRGKSLSIRQLFQYCTEEILGLVPIMLMSPFSVAQYLPPQKELFDLVIFDEASQLRMEECVGAIVRAKQVIIVGDSKQLPPTNFFRQAMHDGGDDLVGDNEIERTLQSDQESLLEDAEVSSLAQCMLMWHYRSRHESLIAFSNMKYYDNKLLTFPSPSQQPAVHFHYVPDGVYGRGDNQTNQREADALVEKLMEVVDKLTEANESVGIVTLNIKQRELIDKLIDKQVSSLPADSPKRDALKQLLSDEHKQPLFVKNLENVQGDERDIMFLSIGFGPDKNGEFTLQFGPISQQHGPKRLNVAITRARKEMHVFSSFRSRQLKEANPTKSLKPGVVDLGLYLDYAETGKLPTSDSDALESRGKPDSGFEEEVIAALAKNGWKTVSQVGVGRYRIDIGVRDPRDSFQYLAGVECDGATYHSGYTARIRDKCRQDRLEEQGWKILRVWSQDWWQNPEHATKTLHEELTTLCMSEEGSDDSDGVVGDEGTVDGKKPEVD